MGTGTSTLSSIDSLSDSLTNIEHKLAVIEDSYQHHERTICHDDSVIISGAIGQTDVRLLLEVNGNADITLNFFVIDELATDARFQCQDVFSIRANVPVARSFKSLSPGTRYAMYIGGINSEETIMNYATFFTLPSDDTPVRILFLHGGRVDKAYPGEVNLWNDVEVKVTENGVHTGVHKSMKDIINDLDNTDTTIITPTPTGIQSRSSKSPIHMIVHNGDFLSVDNELRRRSLELIDVIVRDDLNNDTWRYLLIDLEDAIRNLYRIAFNNPTIKTIAKRCGNVFVAGQGESGMVIASMLTMGSRHSGYDEGGKNDAESLESAAGDSTLVGGTVRKIKKEALSTKDEKQTALEDLKLLVIGAIERVVRRVCWSYMRQLYDENYDEMLLEDSQGELILRKILHCQKVILVKKTMSTYLQRTIKKLANMYDDNYTAHEQVTQRYNLINNDISALEKDVKEIIQDFKLFSNQMRNWPNGAVMDLGQVVLVVVETAWGWLSPDGTMQSALANRDVSIHSYILTSIEKYINVTDGTYADKSSVSKRAIVLITPFTIMPTNNLTLQPSGGSFNEPQMFKFSGLDCKAIISLCAKWQQNGFDRAVLIAGASDTVATEGWLYPSSILNSNNNDDDTDDSGKASAVAVAAVGESEGYDDKRSKMRQIIIGRLDRRNKNRMDAPVSLTDAPSGGVISYDTSTFSSEFDSRASCSRRCYWDVSLLPSEPPMQTDTAFSLGKPASFITKCVTDWKSVNIVVGPVVGKVTSSSANVLLETSTDGHVELLCKDTITGLEYTCCCYMYAYRPSIFRFDELISNHPYDVLLSGPSLLDDVHRRDGSNDVSSSDFNTSIQSVMRGSFTTKRAAIDSDSIGDHRVKIALRTDVSKKLPTLLPPSAAEVTAAATLTDASAATCRILVTGMSKPSWLRYLSEDDHADVHHAGLGSDREYLNDGMILTRGIVNVLSQSYADIALTIHCGYNVDVAAVCDTALTLLARAEEVSKHNLLRRNGKGDAIAHSISDDHTEVMSLLAQAEEHLRNAYRIHWGSSSAKPFLSHGSHLFISSPMLDLLTAFNAASIRQLYRDLTLYATEHLLAIIAKLTQEYQRSLWEGSTTVHYMMNSKVCVFTLEPRLLVNQEHFGTSQDNLISEDTFHLLSSILLTATVAESSSIECLMIVSPLPIVKQDHFSMDASPYTPSQRGMSYTAAEITRLLDVVTQWVDAMSASTMQRKVVFITGGVGVARCTDISVEHVNASAVTTDDKQTAPASIVQLSVGSMVGVPGDDVWQHDGVLRSTSRTYKYKHHSYMKSSHCGIVEYSTSTSSLSSDYIYLNDQKQLLRGNGVTYKPFTVECTPDPSLIPICTTVSAYLSGKPGDKAHYRDADADSLIRAIDYCCVSSADIFSQCHTLFREKYIFGLPLLDGSVVEEAMMTAAHWIITRLPTAFQTACPLPHSFAIRQTWLHYIATRDGLDVKFSDDTARVDFVDKLLTSAEVLTTSLCTDVHLFSAFINRSMQVQVLLEHFSILEGYHD